MSPVWMAAKRSTGSSSAVAEPGGRDRGERLVLQLRPVERGDGPQPVEVEGPPDDIDVVVGEVELPGQQFAHLVGHGLVDLEAHRPPEPAPAQLHLDRGQQIVGLVLLEGQVGVAGDPEGMVALDVHAREERAEVGGDDLVERYEPLPVRRDDEAGQQRWHLDPGKTALPARRVAHDHRQVERQVGDVGEGVAGVDRQRGQDREDSALRTRPRCTPGRRRRGCPSWRAGCRRRPVRER